MSHPLLTIQGLRAALAADVPPSAAPAGADQVREVHAAAAALAADAWRKGDRAARALAERLLYQIHVQCAFSAPPSLLPGIVWMTLLEAHRRSVLASARVEPFDPAKLGARMKEAVERFGCFNHPLVEEMTLPESTRLFGIWCKNWYGSTHGYTFQMTSVAQRLAPESDISAYTPTVFKNLSDELADEFSHTPHHVLRYRIVQRAGASYDVMTGVDDPEMVTEAFALSNYRTAVANLADPMFALGSVYGIEANWVLETPRLASRLRAVGYDAKTLESYDIHATLDVSHAAEWLEMVQQIPMTPERAAAVLTGAIAGLQVRRAMYDAVQAAFGRGAAREASAR